MNGILYTVKKDDTLWDLAARHMGSPYNWPALFEHNNKPEIINLTRTRILDPDLILIGQKLHIPVSTPSASPTPESTSKGKTKARPLGGIPFKYELNNLPSSKIVGPGFIAELKLTGSVTLQNVNASNLLEVAQNNLVLSAKKESDLALNKLVVDNKISWNPKTKEIKFENGFTINSNLPNSPSYSVTNSVSSMTGLPVIKISVIYPPIKGKLGDHAYATANYSVDIELTPTTQSPGDLPTMEPVTQPVYSTDTNDTTDWVYLGGAALIASAGILIVATLAEDVFTAGIGIADDPVCFAAASAMFATGLAVFTAAPGQHPITLEGGEI